MIIPLSLFISIILLVHNPLSNLETMKYFTTVSPARWYFLIYVQTPISNSHTKKQFEKENSAMVFGGWKLSRGNQRKYLGSCESFRVWLFLCESFGLCLLINTLNDLTLSDDEALSFDMEEESEAGNHLNLVGRFLVNRPIKLKPMKVCMSEVWRPIKDVAV